MLLYQVISSLKYLVKTSIEGIIKTLILINSKKTFIKLTGETYFLAKNVDDAYDSSFQETEKIINKHIRFEKVSKQKLKGTNKKAMD